MRKQLIGVLTLVALLFLWVPTARMAASDYTILVKVDKASVMISATNANFLVGDTVSVDLYTVNDAWLLNRTTTVTIKGRATFSTLNFGALKLPEGSYKVRVAKGVELSDDYADKSFVYASSTKPTPTPITLTGLKLDATTTRFRVNQTVQLQVKPVPANAVVGNVHWFSSDETVASIDPYTGLLTTKSPGSTYVVVTNDDGTLVDGRSILVYVPVSGVTINKTKVTVRRKKSTMLLLSALPKKASLPQMTWTSNDPKHKVLKWTQVGSGGLKITGVAAGTVTLKAKSPDGKFKVTCKVTVKK